MMTYGPVFEFRDNLALLALTLLKIPWSCASAWPRLIDIIANQQVRWVCPVDMEWINLRLNDESKYQATIEVFTRMVTGTMSFQARTPTQRVDVRKWLKRSLPAQTLHQCRIDCRDVRVG